MFLVLSEKPKKTLPKFAPKTKKKNWTEKIKRKSENLKKKSTKKI